MPDGSMPRNSLPNGKPAPDSFNTQLDECAYPLIMALAVGLTDNAFYKAHIAPAANFVASHGPSFGPERWEEQSGFSPSTISAEIAGLHRGGDHRRQATATATPRACGAASADEFQRNLKKWTLTTNGPLSAEPYFIRLSKTGDPNAAIIYNVGNGGPTLDQRTVIDAGFLEYARLGLLQARRRGHRRSLPVVDATIKPTHRQRRRLPALQRRRLRRRRDRRPSVGAVRTRAPGTRGRCSPASAASTRSTAAAVGGAVAPPGRDAQHGSGVGLIPEQAWDAARPAPRRPSAPTRRSPRSASATASPPARPRR